MGWCLIITNFPENELFNDLYELGAFSFIYRFFLNDFNMISSGESL